MKRLFALMLALVVSISLAQTQTTGNLVNPLAWTGQSMSGAINNNPRNPLGCCTGNTAYVDTGNQQGGGGIYFSYNQATVQQTIAINNALQGSGVQISGYNYSWNYWNNGYNAGTLTGNIALTAPNGATLQNYNYNMGATGAAWTPMSGTQTFTNPYALSAVSGLRISFSGHDNRGWAGYYGPAVTNIDVRLNYGSDPCASNPLSSTSCPNYQAAYTAQQCMANPLYSTACPGYQTAYFNQQCSGNPLYATTCPGYQAAYVQQQCSINPLYGTACPGYQQAYFAQQCTANPLYDTACPGYQTAYFNQQCTANQLYSAQCPGYQAAYHDQQCRISALFASDCPGYAAAYQARQFADSCKANPQPGCSNYVAPTVTAAPAATATTVPVAVPTPVQSATAIPSTTSPTSVTSVTSVVNSPSSSSPTSATSLAQTTTNDSSSSASSTTTTTTSGSTTTASARPASKADEKKSAEAKAKAASENMKKATSLEAQVAAQGALVATMGYVPGFSAYQNSIVPDVNALQMARQYGKPTVDNRSAQRRLSGSSETLWNEMVESQYKLGN